jgi:hypothetical protein
VPAEAVDDLYFAILGRHPTTAERQIGQQVLAAFPEGGLENPF